MTLLNEDGVFEGHSVAIFAAEHNTPGFKPGTKIPWRDADEFKREAERFKNLFDDFTYRLVDNSKPLPARRRAVLDWLAASKGLDIDTVAFFCHGWATGVQHGFTSRNSAQMGQLAMAIRGVGAKYVLLYCCSNGADVKGVPAGAGAGDRSFADQLRDRLCQLGVTDCRVVAHTKDGHCARNPYARFFDGMGSIEGGQGGYEPVGPKSTLWKPWRKQLADPDNTLRFELAYLSVAEIHQRLLT
jgi:hypothetical protein